ncbi:MAG: chemotaxis protein methyltransferase CheR, partial [Acidobacteriota bacterium]
MTIEASAAARSDAEAPLSASQFALVCELVESRAGLDFREARRSLLESSLRARMQQLDLDTLDAYVARLSGADSAVEFDALISTLTITETQFLRDPAQFALLREHILPTLMAQRGATRDRRLRICSAGCSSGEEPYSLALSWREMDPAARHGWALEIVGIDVNVQMLEVARRRLYPARALRNLDAEVTGRYFTAGDCAFEIDAGLAAAVRFEHGSLLDEGTLGSERYDIIVCKNVSIYFSLEMTRRLVERLHT